MFSAESLCQVYQELFQNLTRDIHGVGKVLTPHNPTINLDPHTRQVDDEGC
jgi:hypothetical protein